MEDKPLKSQIIKLRRKIYENLKSRALDLETYSKDLDEYLIEQTESSKREFKVIDISLIKEKVINSDITYIGDFHTFDQNIRNVLRILKVFSTEENKCVIALEMIHADYQTYIDAYLDRHITDLEFLESINYHTSWRFPWSHYKEIFDMAKKYGMKVIGLNTEGSLSERDDFAAETLSSLKKINPDCKLIVLYGELHITKNKIPRIFQELEPQTKYTIIHQNLDEVYWQLIDNGQEEGIVSFSDSEYCIISAPPWIKYESMIYWYENLSADPDFDIHEYIIENGKKVFSDDTDETFVQLSNEIITHLDLFFSKEEIEDFNLYDHTQLEYVEDQLIKNISNENIGLFQYLIETNRSFKIPWSNSFYCSSYSMNRISYLVGSHIFHLQFEKQRGKNFKLHSNLEYFIYFCFDSLYSYFFSKVINPHRKCDMYGDLAISSPETQGQERFRKLAIQFLDSKNINMLTENINLKDLYESSLIAGNILGEYLYRMVTIKVKEQSSPPKLLDFTLNQNCYIEFRDLLLSNRDYKKHLKRYF